jgi:hypothetical protein
MPKKTRIGEVIESYWDDEEKCIRFTIEIDQSRRKVSGRINSGFDHETRVYVAAQELKQKAKSLLGMVVYDRTGKIDPAKVTYDDLQNLRFNVSLADMDMTTTESPYRLTFNSFLSRL